MKSQILMLHYINGLQKIIDSQDSLSSDDIDALEHLQKGVDILLNSIKPEVASHG